MRLLTVISGTIICLTGVFCFAVYINPFSDVAFLIGLVMMLAGIMLTVSYLISGRGDKRLTDTALVEGLVTLLYGFAVINDQVTDNILIMFFGAWMTLCGITRISQSLYISRFNRRRWARVLPLGIVSAMIGIVMMMPSLLSSVMPLVLVGAAFVVNGLSMLVYAMFMRRKDANASRTELSARERAEARRQLKKTERQEKEALRTLSSEERAAAKAKKLEEKIMLAESKKAEKAARKEARKEEKTAEAIKSGLTIHVSKQEVEEIVTQAPPEQLKEDAKVAAKAAAVVPESVVQAAAAEAASKVSIKLPKDIPAVKVEMESPEEIELRELKEAQPKVRVAAVNLEEIEKAPQIELPAVELPKLDLASENAKVDRKEVISQIENVSVPEAEVVDYTPLDLDELFADVPSKGLTEEEQKKEKKRFTQVLSFDWSEPDFTEVKL